MHRMLRPCSARHRSSEPVPQTSEVPPLPGHGTRATGLPGARSSSRTSNATSASPSSATTPTTIEGKRRAPKLTPDRLPGATTGRPPPGRNGTSSSQHDGQTYQPQAVHALQQPHHAMRQYLRHGNRLSNVYWGRTPPLLRDRPQNSKSDGKRAKARRDQRIEHLAKEVAEIRQVIEGAMGDLAKLKDHVDHQLDVWAPFAFLFNQVTQVPPDNPFVAGQDRRPEEWELESEDGEQTLYTVTNYPVQVDPGRVGEHGAQGSLYQITQDPLGARDGRTNRTGGGQRDHVNPHPFQDMEGGGPPGSRRRGTASDSRGH